MTIIDAMFLSLRTKDPDKTEARFPIMESQTARSLPGSVVYLALAALFILSLLARPLVDSVPPLLLVATMAVAAAVIYWLIAAACLRSDPRLWRPDSAWYRANLKSAPPDQREAAVRTCRAELAPRLRRELSILAAVGAAIGAIAYGEAGSALAAAAGGFAMWRIGGLLDLHTVADEARP